MNIWLNSFIHCIAEEEGFAGKIYLDKHKRLLTGTKVIVFLLFYRREHEIRRFRRDSALTLRPLFSALKFFPALYIFVK